MKNYVLTQLLLSKKFWLGLSSIIIPLVARALEVDEDSVSKIWYSLLAMLLGQSAADFGNSKK